MVDIDEVIQVIRSSDDAEAAKTKLIAVFDLDEIQAQYILDLRLRRLTKMSRIELEAERDDLKRRIEELERILASDERLTAWSLTKWMTPWPNTALPAHGAAG